MQSRQTLLQATTESTLYTEPIQLPIGAEDTFRGIIDLIEMKAEIYYDEMGKDYRQEEIPADMLDKAEKFRASMIEAIAETDEALMEKYFEGEEISATELRKALRKATINNEIVPMLCGTSYRNKGVQLLLDAIVEYMPAPTDVENKQSSPTFALLDNFFIVILFFFRCRIFFLYGFCTGGDRRKKLLI